MTRPTINLHIDLTTRCNLKCVHCRVIQESHDHELSVAEISSIVSRLAQTYRFRGISLGGGEPLLRSDLTDILAKLHTIIPGIAIAITSNGWMLGKATAAILVNTVGMVQVSLDGASAAVHDSIRGVKGSFHHAVQGIANCVSAGIPTAVRYTVMKANCEEAVLAYELANDLGAVRFGIRRVIPAGRALAGYSKIAISPDAYKQLILELIAASEKPGRIAQVYGGDPLMNVIGFTTAVQRMFRDGYFAGNVPGLQQLLRDPRSRLRWFGGCAPGAAYLYIAANGNIYVCPMLRHLLGNALHDDIPSLVESSDLLNSIRRREFDGKCGVCRYRYICGGCRAAAFEFDGNILGEDPMCPFAEQEIAEVSLHELSDVRRSA